MEPRMMTDISALCTHHNCRMVLAQEPDARGFIQNTYAWFYCPENGCTLNYDTGHGYREKVDETNFKASKNVKRCTECSQHLYLAKRGATTADTDWLCANAECASNSPARRQ
jgi:hypothetical protein